MRVVKKYEFPDKETADEYIATVDTSSRHSVVRLGVVNGVYCVDVLWWEAVDVNWSAYEIEYDAETWTDANGLHQFNGFSLA